MHVGELIELSVFPDYLALRAPEGPRRASAPFVVMGRYGDSNPNSVMGTVTLTRYGDSNPNSVGMCDTR